MGVSTFEATRLQLARLSVHGQDELRRGMASAAAATAHAAGVARVGVWFLSTDHRELICAAQYDRERDAHSADVVLPLAEFPVYAEALVSRRTVAVKDARAAPETRELAVSYLEPNGITSMLDAPVYRTGEVVGVVCLEHVGAQREWTNRERDLAASVADVVAVLLEQATRWDAESRLRAQQERVAKAEKLEALTRFGAGIAHDFNNVLAAIVLQLQVLGRKKASEEQVAGSVAEIMQSAELGQRIVQQLLTYCRGQPSQPREIDLGKTVGNLRPFLVSAVGDRCGLVMDGHTTRAIVYADPAQIEQLLMNLVVNARDSMPNGGEVRVELSAESDWVWLRVSDHGQGIDETVRDKIFEPFFTTKGQRGTGLGLSTCQTIVELHRGKIEVASEPGKGTTFSVRLPRTA